MKSGVCLVTGGTGALGPSVVTALQQHWDSVRVVTRDPERVRSLLGSVELVAGDITRPDDIRNAIRDCDAVVHLAAHLHVNKPTLDDAGKYESVNVTATKSVVETAQAAGAHRIVFASTIAVYGYGRGLQMDEQTEPQPQTAYGLSKLRAEEIVLAARREDGQALASVLRLGAVYGPRVKGNYRRLLEALARRRFVAIGRGQNRRSLVHEQDAARAIALATVHPDAAGRIYNVTDGACHPLAAIIDAICSALGRRPPRWSVPTGVAHTLTAGADLMASVVGRRGEAGEMLQKYLEDVCVCASRVRELGFVPAFDQQSGWRQVVQSLRARGELP